MDDCPRSALWLDPHPCSARILDRHHARRASRFVTSAPIAVGFQKAMSACTFSGPTRRFHDLTTIIPVPRSVALAVADGRARPPPEAGATRPPTFEDLPVSEAHSGRAGASPVLQLSLAALGVVYGDIGTSPLYALRECFHGPHAMAVTSGNVLGVLSLVFWSLALVVTTKYVGFILQADNRGEGGILALLALLLPGRASTARPPAVLVLLGLFGAALLYGDSMITPAISVLSAVEGLEIVSPAFGRLVLPLTLAILVVLFSVQRHGTARVGAIFGPVMILWFTVLGALGLMSVARAPSVLRAVLPSHAFAFFRENGIEGFLILGTVVLVVTGGEALYADMGHFGRRPIRIAWFGLVLPALLVNYFGQGALLLADPAAARSPFYLIAPEWALYPLVALGTAATIIASQAVISGAFSLSRQAVQLGFSPRLVVAHTSATEIGQIYVPQVNSMLFVATAALVLGFRSSSNLAAAYGIAVAGTMTFTTILFCAVARRQWRWSVAAVAATGAAFLLLDGAFFAATLTKIANGGWFPLAVGAGIFTIMTTWKRGRSILAKRLRAAEEPLERFLERLPASPLPRVPGVAIFLNSDAVGTPPALIQNIKHNRILHQRVAILTVRTEEVPHVDPERRVDVHLLDHGFCRIVGWYGFMEEPDVPALLREARSKGFDCRAEETTFFLARETLLATDVPGMAIWRERLFSFLSRNAERATTFFHLPADRVIEVGTLIRL